MVSAARIIFAGIGTIFVIIAIGVGGGLMLAKTALKEPAGYQAPANTESTASVRLPRSAEAAQPPRPDAAAVPKPDPQTPVQPSIKQVQAPTGKQVGQVDTRKAQAQERRRRYAERKARKIAAARAWQQHEQWTRERSEPGIMAFDGYESRSGGFNLGGR